MSYKAQDFCKTFYVHPSFHCMLMIMYVICKTFTVLLEDFLTLLVNGELSEHDCPDSGNEADEAGQVRNEGDGGIRQFPIYPYTIHLSYIL